MPHSILFPALAHWSNLIARRAGLVDGANIVKPRLP
jgi:hypothetical protein